MDYGFSRYESVLLCEEEALLKLLSVVGGTDSYVMACNVHKLRVTLPKGHGPISQAVELPRFVYAPTYNAESLGKVVLFCDVNGDGSQEIIGEAPLIACYSVTRHTPKKSFWQWLLGLFGFFK